MLETKRYLFGEDMERSGKTVICINMECCSRQREFAVNAGWRWCCLTWRSNVTLMFALFALGKVILFLSDDDKNIFEKDFFAQRRITAPQRQHCLWPAHQS